MNRITADQALAPLEWLKKKCSFLKQPVFKNVVLGIATLLFAGGLWIAHRAHPGLFDNLHIGAWIVLLGLVIVTVCLNAIVFWLTARIGAVRSSVGRALVTTVISTAANLLPIPGGAAVRTVALTSGAGTYKKAVTLTILVGVGWLGIASAIASTGFALLELFQYGLLAALIALASTMTAATGLRRFPHGDYTLLILLFLAQSFLALTGGLRLYFCFKALGEVVLVEQVLVLLFAPVASSFVGIAPAGLGLTELTAAGLAALIGVLPAVAFVAAALNRVSGLIVITPIAASMNLFFSPKILGENSETMRRKEKE